MTIDELKRALVEVRKMCKDRQCVNCPLHKIEPQSNIPYCPLYENEDGITVGVPVEWEIADWEEDSNDTTTA